MAADAQAAQDAEDAELAALAALAELVAAEDAELAAGVSADSVLSDVSVGYDASASQCE